MENKKEMTAPNVSVGADTEQSIQKCTDISINDNDENIKDLDESFREMQREMLRQMDPSYLKTVSMSALYDTDFETQTALIDGLLYQGTYLFVGSPKVGKSFMKTPKMPSGKDFAIFGNINSVDLLLPKKTILVEEVI